MIVDMGGCANNNMQVHDGATPTITGTIFYRVESNAPPSNLFLYSAVHSFKLSVVVEPTSSHSIASLRLPESQTPTRNVNASSDLEIAQFPNPPSDTFEVSPFLPVSTTSSTSHSLAIPKLHILGKLDSWHPPVLDRSGMPPGYYLGSRSTAARQWHLSPVSDALSREGKTREDRSL